MVDTTALFNLSETFVSVQGEGSYLGQPSFFIRSSGCNLRCRWENTLCDTDYTSWTPEQNQIPVQELLAQVSDLRKEHPNVFHIVVTGGEPMVQPAIFDLLTGLKEQELFITLETNATIAPPPGLPVDLVSLSPKLASSTPVGTEFADMHEQSRIKYDALQTWTSQYNCQLKFVILDKNDENEIKTILSHLDKVKPEQVFLMPEGINIEQLREHARHCVTIALHTGWRYTPRAHIEIYGNQRGT